MALIGYQAQGPCSTFALNPKPLSKGLKLKPSVSFHSGGRIDKLLPLKHHFHIRGKPFVTLSGKAFEVSSFKGNGQNGESEGGDRSSRFCKSSLKLSSSQQERKETISECQLPKHRISYLSEEPEGTSTGSLPIQQLLRKWLIALRTQTFSPEVDENFSDSPAHIVSSESQQITMKTKAGEMVKAAMMYFIGLDAAISLPLLIFIPWYLTVRVVYGAEVSKELIPLWILGPLVVALYVKIIQGLCSLYVFCFNQVIGLVRNLPSHSMLVYGYIAEGKLKTFLWSIFCKPIVDIIYLDYKEVFNKKQKQLVEWAVEKYLDYVESVWPYYCRTIRFLKKANLI